uniref:hypothetical protein n=1 Tax=Pedobacter sp. TaxID=1411316 RepID=UPI0015EF8E42|nr:hypothetical protein [Pedobacter sp.]
MEPNDLKSTKDQTLVKKQVSEIPNYMKPQIITIAKVGLVTHGSRDSVDDDPGTSGYKYTKT